MNIVLISPEELIVPGSCCLTGGEAKFTGGVAVLTGRRFEHLVKVLKIVERENVCRIGVVGGLTGEGRCLECDMAAGRLVLELRLDAPPPPALPLTLAAALPRPKTLRKMLQYTVSLGVKRLCFFGAFKVDKSYWTSPLLAEENWRAEAMLALEQSGDTVLPEISFHRFFKPFVEDELPSIIAGGRLLTAHPGAESRCPVDVAGSLTLCMGPEGGFTDYEVDLLRSIGAETVSIGDHILRSEVAAVALISRLFPR